MKKALFGQDAKKYGGVGSTLIMDFKSLPSIVSRTFLTYVKVHAEYTILTLRAQSS